MRKGRVRKVPNGKEPVSVGQGEMASSCTREGLDWILEK